MSIVLNLITLAAIGYLAHRLNQIEEKTMRNFTSLDKAVEAVNEQTNLLGETVKGVQAEIASAEGDQTKIDTAAAKLTDVAQRLQLMAAPKAGGTPVSGGGGATTGPVEILVPIEGEPLAPVATAAGITLAD